jgi:hypothetical protein
MGREGWSGPPLKAAAGRVPSTRHQAAGAARHGSGEAGGCLVQRGGPGSDTARRAAPRRRRGGAKHQRLRRGPGWGRAPPAAPATRLLPARALGPPGVGRRLGWVGAWACRPRGGGAGKVRGFQASRTYCTCGRRTAGSQMAHHIKAA